MKNQKGFALIELMIIFVIAALIGAIAVSSIIQARKDRLFLDAMGFDRHSVTDTTRPYLQPLVTERLILMHNKAVGTLHTCEKLPGVRGAAQGSKEGKEFRACMQAAHDEFADNGKVTEMATAVGFQ